ncbi:hypothetical protein A3747_01795 [Sulfitobacter sp. HI0076]|jgi:hypothetical protein|nr:hypothetical protein [Sulfitobacter sp. HI0076]KZX93283.1 hypothetical protein A3720_05310 [Sulfitobacter sp. HI0021]KZY00345.1 hypothetical protein A3722_10855 [Sulfitobacter sp. HI0027]KZZ03177.1 hypothetical protein A3747_01795 [Sulfitobacter sp. HI0076]
MLIGGLSIGFILYEVGAFVMDARDFFGFLSENADGIYQFSQTPLFSWILPFLILLACSALIRAASMGDERRHRASEAARNDILKEIKSNNGIVALLISEGKLQEELFELGERFRRDQAVLGQCLNKIKNGDHGPLGLSHQQAQSIIQTLTKLSLVKSDKPRSIMELDPEGDGFGGWMFQDEADRRDAYAAFANAAASIEKIQGTIQDIKNELDRIKHERSDRMGETSRLIGISRYGLAEYEPSASSDYQQEVLLRAKHGKDLQP